MKSSLMKLKKFRLHKSDGKAKTEFLPSAQLGDLEQASQDMKDMRDCYDSLLAAAAAMANSAYEFSESMKEMGNCLLEKTTLNNDEESGRLLLMLGKVQFELQKLVDSYRSHIFLTITTPSESLLNELRTVEEMKRQCDEKRKLYEYMMVQHGGKGRSKSGKGGSFDLQKLKTAHDEYEEEATLCVFRLKSLKQGQTRSLLTQAARHHAAQMSFFQKGLKSLEAVDRHVRLVTEQQHIDYQFTGLEEDEGQVGDYDVENGYNVDKGELSFDYRRNNRGSNIAYQSQKSLEADLDNNKEYLTFSCKVTRAGSHSAPIVAEKLDPSEKMRQMRPSPPRKANTYVLPTPIDAHISLPSRNDSSVPHTRRASFSGHPDNLWHSSPLELERKDLGNDNLSNLFLRESNGNGSFIRLSSPLDKGLSSRPNAHGTERSRRQSFSGPLGPQTSRHSSVKLTFFANPPTSSSPSASPPLVSSPRISELHELPRPPDDSTTKPAKSPNLVGHSAPLGFKNQGPTRGSKSAPSPLPTPNVPRSFSIPSSSQRATAVHVAKLFNSPPILQKAEAIASPPLTPISLSRTKPS